MDNGYIVNGKVARDSIAMDISYRKLDRAGIEQLCGDPQIRDAFRGTEYADKRPQREWNKEYLGLLSSAVVAESFNRDYLLYLDEVADFVARAPRRRSIIVGVAIVLLITAAIIARLWGSNR